MKNGPYTMVVAPEWYPGRRYRERYAYEHHVKYYEAHGVSLHKDQVIHHINGDKRDNRPENLELLTAKSHAKEHGQERRARSIVNTSCGQCNKPMALRGATYRSRLKYRKYGKLFCSISCGTIHQFSIRDVGQGDTSRAVNSE